MVRRLVYVAMTQHDRVVRLAERCNADFIDQSDAIVAQALTYQSRDDVTRVSSAQASQRLQHTARHVTLTYVHTFI